MSSDGKPLWGFRKIFLLLGIFFGVCAVWTVVDLVNPDPRFAEKYPPGSADHTILMILVPFCALLSAGNLWLRQQLLRGHYTRRAWVVGVWLLLPTVVFIPFGILCMACWCVKSCKSLFHPRFKSHAEPAGTA
jgi:hypothetical protein